MSLDEGKFIGVIIAKVIITKSIFSSHDKCAAYTNKLSKKFGDCKEIHRS